MSDAVYEALRDAERRLIDSVETSRKSVIKARQDYDNAKQMLVNAEKVYKILSEDLAQINQELEKNYG